MTDCKRPRDSENDTQDEPATKRALQRQMTPQFDSDSDSDSDACSDTEDPATLHVLWARAIVLDTRRHKDSFPTPKQLRECWNFGSPTMIFRKAIGLPHYRYGDDIELVAGMHVVVACKGEFQRVLTTMADGTIETSTVKPIWSKIDYVFEQAWRKYYGSRTYCTGVCRGKVHPKRFDLFEYHSCDCVKQGRMKQGETCKTTYCHRF